MPHTTSPTHEKFILALDLGTTSVRACLMNQSGQIIAKGQQPVPQIYPQHGWVEHDPAVLWKLALDTAHQAMASARIFWPSIAGIGITNQRETTIVWDKETGQPVYNAIVWQCRRTAPLCESLKQEGLASLIQEKTGLIIDPYFSATKLRWLLDNVPETSTLLSQNRLLFGTVDTWILWNLSGRKLHITDVTNASRTMLFNIHTKTWDSELLERFGIPETMLPSVTPSSALFGTTDPNLTGDIAIPLAGNAGDQQAALFGQRCWQSGCAKSTYGTGAFLMLNTGDTPVQSRQGLLTTLAVGADDDSTFPAYALEGAIFIAGAALEWLRKNLCLYNNPDDIDRLACQIDNTDGVYFVPAFTGLGAPYWQPEIRGLITGLTQDTSPAHLVRSAVEAMAYQTLDVLAAMREEAKLALTTLRIDGGVARSDFLMQFLANILNLPINRTADTELTAKGAGYLAGLAIGFWPSPKAILALPESLTTVHPASSFNESERTALIAGWQSAVKKALLRN